jgi:hypothetical protein
MARSNGDDATDMQPPPTTQRLMTASGAVHDGDATNDNTPRDEGQGRRRTSGMTCDDGGADEDPQGRRLVVRICLPMAALQPAM